MPDQPPYAGPVSTARPAGDPSDGDAAVGVPADGDAAAGVPTGEEREPAEEPEPEPSAGLEPAAVQVPRPRRTRRGEVLVGPSVGARYRPGALVGLPLISLVLSPLIATALETGIRSVISRRIAAGHPPSALPSSLLPIPYPVLLILGFLVAWALLALWALVPLVLTSRAVLLDEERGTVVLRRGLRRSAPRELSDVLWAVGGAERDAVALVGLTDPGSPPETDDGHGDGEADGDEADDDEVAQPIQWVVPAIGWDDASFDGLRALQAATGFPAAPPRPVLAAVARRQRQAQAHREMADRILMPWREEYAADPAAFQRDFDHARRVLGGKEPSGPAERSAPR